MPFINKLIVTLALWSFYFTDLTAQTYRADTEFIYTQKLTIDDGLSESVVNTIIKDHDGFIWAGTDDGLNRFDGYSFKTFNYDPKDSTSLGNDKVNVLYTDSRNKLWVGTSNGGLNFFHNKTQTFKRFIYNPKDENSLAQNNVLSILEDNEHNLWVGTYNGLNVFNPEKGTFKRYFAEKGDMPIGGNIIYALMKDERGRIWAGTDNGITIFNQTAATITHLGEDNMGSKLGAVLSLCQGSDGDIWIGTSGEGAIRFNEERKSFQRYKTNFQDNSGVGSNLVRKIRCDKKGNILLGTDGGGISIYDNQSGNFRRMASRNDRSLLNAAIYDLYIDNENILWIGTYGGGIKIFNTNQKYFTHYDIFDSAILEFGKNSVLAMAEDKNKNIWIGTDGAGLYKFDPLSKSFSSYRHDPGNKNTISSNVIKSLLVDRLGNIYAGTYNGGLNYIDVRNNTITIYTHDPGNENSIGTNNIWCLFQDSESRVWIGSNTVGLDEFSPDKKIFTHYKPNAGDTSSISSGVVFSIFEDSHKNIWVGTRDDGLNKLNKADGTFTRYTVAQGLSSNEIRDILQDHNGRLWIATTSGGLNYYDSADHKFHAYRKQGYSEDDVLSLLEDDIGNLWLGTFSGLLRVNPVTGKVRHYDVGDGLQGNEFNYGARLKTSTGELCFGGLNGFNIFRAEGIRESAAVPPIVLTGLRLFHNEITINDDTGILHQPIAYQEQLILKPGPNVITIDYAALSYQFPRKNEYQYMLEGFDKKWNYVGSNRSATYTNLPAGEYVFRVIGTNNDGLWNERGATLKIKILPSWYQVRWVQIFLVLVFAGILGGIVRLRTKILVKQKGKLEDLINARTKQIEQQKSEIEFKNEELEKQNEELTARNEEIMAQREEIEEKSNMLERAHEEIQTVNDQLVRVNANLEKQVDLRTQELKQAMRKLIETDEGLNMFLYRSSHDLRGPITTLQGLACLAKMENRQKEIEHYFDKISRSCEHMLKLLKKLNETNEVFREKITSVCINWDDIIKETIRELKKLDPVSEVEVIIENTIGAKTQVYSDPHLIENIIQNLAENAIIFKTNKNPYVKLTLQICNGNLVIKVTDNGIGISEDIKSKIFDMFYRGSEHSIGNGLGLYLVKKSTELLGGEIQIFNKVRNLTEVSVKIPLR